MDTGTAYARKVMEVLKFTTELEEQRVGQPERADRIDSQVPVHQLGNGLANPAKSDIPCSKDPKNRTDTAVISFTFRSPLLDCFSAR